MNLLIDPRNFGEPPPTGVDVLIDFGDQTKAGIAAGPVVTIRKIAAGGVATADLRAATVRDFSGIVIGQTLPGVLRGSPVESVKLIFLVRTKSGSLYLVDSSPFDEVK